MRNILFLLFLLLCFAFYPAILFAKIFYDIDIFQIHLPFRLYFASTLQDGLLPLWVPEMGCGHPLLADGQAGVFYPLNIPFLYFPNIFTFTFLSIFHYFLGGIFTYLFAREIKISKTGATISTIIFTFSGFATAHFRHTTIINVIAWIPLLFYIIERGIKRGNIVYFTLFAILSSISFFAYYPQIFIIANIFLFVYFFLRILYEKERKNIFLYFILSQIILILLVSVQLLPTLELIKNSARIEGLEKNSAFLDAFPPSYTLSLFLPNYQVKITSWELTGYVGVLSLVLSILSITKKNKYIYLMLILGITSLVFSYGGYFFFLKYLYQIPPFNLFRGSARNLVIFVFAIAILAGSGIDKIKVTSLTKTVVILLIFFDLYFFSVKKNIIYTTLCHFEKKLQQIRDLKVKQHQERLVHFGGISPPNMNILTKISSVNIYSPLTIKNYNKIVSRPTTDNISKLLSIKYKCYPDEIIYIKNDLPRVWIVNKLKDENSNCPEMLDNEKYDIYKEVILNKKDINKYKNLLKNEEIKFSAKILNYSPQKITISAKLNTPGILILNDVYYPGWKATVNKKEKEIIKVNCALRGIFLKEGNNIIVMHYLPIVFVTGAIISFLTITIVILFIIKKCKI